VTKRCLHTLLCLDTSLAVASSATATSIALPHCDDAVSGNAKTLWTDFHNGQWSIALTDAQKKMAVGLVEDDVTHTLSDAGYRFMAGKFSPENSGCGLS